MATARNSSAGGSHLLLLVFSLVFFGSARCYVIGSADQCNFRTEEGDSEEIVHYCVSDEQTEADILWERVPEFYPECNNASKPFEAESEPTRLATAFKEIESAAAGSSRVLVAAYDHLLDLILANAKSAGGFCNGDYVQLASKVLELDHADASSSLTARKVICRLKLRFHPGVFKLLNGTAQLLNPATGHLDHALYAIDRPIYQYPNFTSTVFRSFDSRLKSFFWNLVSANESDRSRNEFNLVSRFSNKTFGIPEGQGPLRLVPTAEALLDTKSEFFPFRLTQSSRRQRGWIFYQLSSEERLLAKLPPSLRREQIIGLDYVNDRFEDGSIFTMRDFGELGARGNRNDRANISEELRDLYPPCRNESDIFDKYRLSDFLQVFNVETESAARMRAAYEALLDEIIGSSFLCGQDYVQLAYHVLQRCGDGSATGDDAEQQAWNDFKGRFNPRVFDLFDTQKRWALMSADKPGFAHGSDTWWRPFREYLTRWDKRLVGFAHQFVPTEEGRRFEWFSVISDEIRMQDRSGVVKGKQQFLPTPESILPEAKTFKFWTMTGDEEEEGLMPTALYTRKRFLQSSLDHEEPEECQGWHVNTLNCSAVFYFEDMTDLGGSENVTTVEEARTWYPPCFEEINVLDDWRLWNFFEAFNAETKSSSVLVAAYNAMFDAITTNSSLICSQDYVQLAFKVQQIQQSLNSSEEDQENWARLRSRFNPMLLDLFDENKIWRIKSVEHPNYAILKNDCCGEHGSGLRNNLELLELESRFPAFNWRFKPLNGDVQIIDSIPPLTSTGDGPGGDKPIKSQWIKRIVPTPGSLTENATVLQFNMVGAYEHREFFLTYYQINSTKNVRSWYENQPPIRPGFLWERNMSHSFEVLYERDYKTYPLFYLEAVDETAPSTGVSVAKQIKELLPPCETQGDALTLDRLWDVFQVFHLDVANSSILIEAYEAALEAILAPSPFNCSADYVQLANQVYELEKKLNRTNANEDQQIEFEGLKNRFNPRVFKLFEEQQLYRILLVNQPGLETYPMEFEAIRNPTSDSFISKSLCLRRSQNTSTTSSIRWSFERLQHASSFLLLNGVERKPWKRVAVLPTAESLNPTKPEFEFELHYLSYHWFKRERHVLVFDGPDFPGDGAAGTARETCHLSAVAVDSASYMANTKFYVKE